MLSIPKFSDSVNKRYHEIPAQAIHLTINHNIIENVPANTRVLIE